MANEREFTPDWASPPGSTIRSILRERNLSSLELSNLLKCSTEEIQRLLEGRMTISIRLARNLSAVLGSSVEFWVSRDFHYRQVSTKLQQVEEKWLAALPIDDMVRFGWLKPAPLPNQEMHACLEFFGVINLSSWKHKYGLLGDHIGFRTSRSFKSASGAVTAWLRQGEIEASLISCARWNRKELRRRLPDIRSLTRQKDPAVFLPLLRTHCASAGVALTVIRAPRGCRASGAVRFLTSQKVIVQLSGRYLVDDQFWFTFFHEIGHLLLQEPREIILDHLDEKDTAEEEDANEFAAGILVPCEHKSEMMQLAHKPRDIIKFARKIGIAPGIVVGQLQYYGLLSHSSMNSLKRRYVWKT